jgi:putative peptide zinc metalloprotease protein
MIRPPTQRASRLRGDLEIVARRQAAESTEPPVRWIHHPVSGAILRLHEADFKRLVSGVHLPNDPLFTQAAAHGLLVDESSAKRTESKWWKNPLYIRLPGIPADAIAMHLARVTGFLFSTWAVCTWTTLFVITAVVLAGHSSELWASLGGLATFQANHWRLALFVLTFTKVLHELGHAAVCRRMGARCRQIGALLLCGTPCLYCDVTDSWRVASPHRRAAIMMAGIYVEWIIASLAAWVWLTSQPSEARMLALHVMMVCGVSTFLFNVNPLMRYDGYFVVSDLLNVTNLRTQAADAWQQLVIAPLVGRQAKRSFESSGVVSMRGNHSSFSKPGFTQFGFARLGFATYHFLAGIYRYVVLIALASWIYLVSTRCGLEPVGRGMMIVVAAVVVLSNLTRLWNVWRGVGMWNEASLIRRTTVVTCLLGLAGFVLLVPMDRRITSNGTVDFADTVTIYAPDTATIQQVAREFGNLVSEQDVLLVLTSPELMLERPPISAEVRTLELKQASYRSRAAAEPELIDRLGTTAAMLDAARSRLQATDAQLEKLTLRAPRSGHVLRLKPNAESMPANTSPELDRLVARQDGTIQQGEAWCRIGNPDHKQVVLSIDAAERAEIEVGMQVRVHFDPLGDAVSGGVIECTVSDISLVAIDAPVNATVLHATVLHATVLNATVQATNRFEVKCDIPHELASRIPIGSTATGIFRGKPFCCGDVLLDRLLGKAR